MRGPVRRSTADLTWGGPGQASARLEANLGGGSPRRGRRDRPGGSAREGMRNLHLRYYAEVFTWGGGAESSSTPGSPVEDIETDPARSTDEGRTSGPRARAPGQLGPRRSLGRRRSLRPVTTVAERLEPPGGLRAVPLPARTGIGLRIFPLDRGGHDVFRNPGAGGARRGGTLIPLLADRDLTAHGLPGQSCAASGAGSPQGPQRSPWPSGAPLFPAIGISVTSG